MIILGADKHGFEVIKMVEEYLKSKGVDSINLGVKKPNEDIKLEDLIPKITDEVTKNELNKGILVCGTGIGVAIGANKIKGIRSTLATESDIAKWSVVYDNCNVLCLSGWKKNKPEIFKILDSFLSAKYDGSEKRLEMMRVFDGWR